MPDLRSAWGLYYEEVLSPKGNTPDTHTHVLVIPEKGPAARSSMLTVDALRGSALFSSLARIQKENNKPSFTWLWLGVCMDISY